MSFELKLLVSVIKSAGGTWEFVFDVDYVGTSFWVTFSCSYYNDL